MRIWEQVTEINRFFLIAVALVLAGYAGIKWLLPMAARPLAGTSDVRRADAIIVLGDELWDGTLSESTLRRTVYAVRLYNQGLSPRIVLAGSATEDSLVQEMYQLTKDLGVVPEDLEILEHSGSMNNQALGASSLFKRMNCRSALLVTSSWEMERAAAVFSRHDLTIYNAPIPYFELFASSLRRKVVLLEAIVPEYCRRALYRLRGWM